MRLEHKAGTDIIYELAVRLYPSSLEPFREAISNALDEGTNKVDLQVSNQEILVEDWGGGIDDVEKFSKFGQASKAGLGGEIIGQKGLGKLSLLRFGEKVNFRTNNAEIGMDIIMTPQDFEYDIKSATKFLDHQGTRIIIPNPKGVPPIDDLANYLKKVFGLRIAKGTEIILNGVKLESSSKIDPHEKFLFRLSGGKVDVTGNLKEDKKGHGNADLYIRHVLVTSLLVDPERKFSGWVNCNELIPTTSRNDVVRDSHGGIFDDFLAHLKDHVRRFPKVEEEITKDEELLGNELNKMLRNYLSELRILPQGTILIGRGNENTLDKQDKTNKKERVIKDTPEEIPEYVKIHTSRKTNKPIKRTVRTDYGIMWVDQNIGNEKEPIFFVEPNMVIRNRTNDIYKFLVKNKASLGSKPVRAFPYLARVAVSMNKESPKWNREQLFLEMDRAIRYFLKNKGEL
jgi:hypothetical protein